MPPKRIADPSQGDLFHQPVYPTRIADETVNVIGFRSRLKRAMSRALKECPFERSEVAMRMAVALGQDTFSLATLNAYTAESNETHDISVVRLKAFVRATGANWIWDLIVADDGLTMLVGDEARLAEIARVEQEQSALAARLKELKAKPVHVVRRQRA